jgi:hypothetical protein
VWNSASNVDTYTLAWSDNYLSGNPTFTEISGISGTWYTHTNLTNGTYLCYKVRGVNTNGPGEYGIPNCTAPDTLPAVPTNVSASWIIANSITLSWDAIANGQWSFDIEYSTRMESILPMFVISAE